MNSSNPANYVYYVSNLSQQLCGTVFYNAKAKRLYLLIYTEQKCKPKITNHHWSRCLAARVKKNWDIVDQKQAYTLFAYNIALMTAFM